MVFLVLLINMRTCSFGNELTVEITLSKIIIYLSIYLSIYLQGRRQWEDKGEHGESDKNYIRRSMYSQKSDVPHAISSILLFSVTQYFILGFS